MSGKLASIGVFCGSKKGSHAQYGDAARAVGELIATREMELVFGAGHIGLMGVVADAALKRGGRVVGVIPQHLVDWELAHPGITELIVVQTMHERKAIMAQRSEAFLALPGGFGTCDEFFEILTWKQLGLHGKPIGVLNTAGFFDPMLQWLDLMVRDGFLRANHREMIAVSSKPEEVLDILESMPPSTWEEKIERA